MSSCSEKCWTPVLCPEHGDRMPPFGRLVSEESHVCCNSYGTSLVNSRHLWDEHDSSRYYTDPTGWSEHENNCAKCNPEAPHE